MRLEAISKEYTNLLKSVKEYFNSSNNTIYDGRNTLKAIEFNGKNYIVKSFKIPNIINKVAYRYFRDSKAKRSYLNSKKLLKLGISVPSPIGYIEFGGLTLKESFYISELFEHDFEIREVLNDSSFEDRENILEEFAKYSYNLHEKGVYHIDYSPGNVLIKKEQSGYKFAIVDLNRMNFINFNNELRFKNLSRFSTSLEDLELIAITYADIANIDKEYAKSTLLKYHNAHQDYLAKKKRLKKLRGKN